MDASNPQLFSNDTIDRFVEIFYARVRQDPFIGPVFHKRIEDWDHHHVRIMAFWKSALKSEATYTMGPKGWPPQLHRAIEELQREHFEHWLSLFAEVVREVCMPREAGILIERSRQMGRSLSAHLSSSYPSHH